MTTIRAIMDDDIAKRSGHLTSLSASAHPERKTLDQEDCFMLPEIERPDYRISTTTTEEEKTCLKCRHLVRLKDSLYGEHDCHTWANLPDEIFTYIFWHLECPQHCGSFEAIAAGGVA